MHRTLGGRAAAGLRPLGSFGGGRDPTSGAGPKGPSGVVVRVAGAPLPVGAGRVKGQGSRVGPGSGGVVRASRCAVSSAQGASPAQGARGARGHRGVAAGPRLLGAAQGWGRGRVFRPGRRRPRLRLPGGAQLPRAGGNPPQPQPLGQAPRQPCWRGLGVRAEGGLCAEQPATPGPVPCQAPPPPARPPLWPCPPPGSTLSWPPQASAHQLVLLTAARLSRGDTEQLRPRQAELFWVKEMA